jgi:predicted ArsR family transcriptional regulator
MGSVKNLKTGLSARSKILNLLEDQALSANSIAQTSKMSYASARHHLRLLETEEKVSRKGQRPCVWVLTGIGQHRLVS